MVLFGCTAVVMSISSQLPELAEPMFATSAPVAGLLLQVSPVSVQVLSATRRTECGPRRCS